MCQVHDEGAGQSEVLIFVGVGDVPCQGGHHVQVGIISNSRKLSGFPECERNEANAGVGLANGAILVLYDNGR